MINFGKNNTSGSVKELKEGRIKLTKDYIVNNPCLVEKVIKGVDIENNAVYFTLLVTTPNNEKGYVYAPYTANEMLEAVEDTDFVNSDVLVYMESKVSKKGRNYYIMWFEKL